MQQQNAVILRLPCVASLKQGETGMTASDKGRKKYVWGTNS